MRRSASAGSTMRDLMNTQTSWVGTHPQLQVFRPIVVSPTINMVNVLMSRQHPTELSFHHHAVFKPIVAMTCKHHYVTLTGFRPPAAPSWICRSSGSNAKAGGTVLPFGSTGTRAETTPADITFNEQWKALRTLLT